MVDADLHNIVANIDELLPYLPEHWREYIEQSKIPGPIDTAYPTGAKTSIRPGSPAGAGQTLEDLRANGLDLWGTEIGILNCTYAVESLHNPDLASALATAVNYWQLEHWLGPEPRLRASLVVPSHMPALAANEIERWRTSPGFVQVLLPARSALPYGHRQYWPIYDKAVENDLVIGIHFGGHPGNPSTPTGWPSYYIEEYVGMAGVFQSQLISLVAEGVFAQFPDLKVVMIEGGWTWLPALMWRLDKEWKGLRREIPWVQRPPSELIGKHLRFTLQPVDAPPQSPHLLEVMAQMQAEELLLFSSDYPHWHSDDLEDGLLAGVTETVRTKILNSNARQFYRV